MPKPQNPSDKGNRGALGANYCQVFHTVPPPAAADRYGPLRPVLPEKIEVMAQEPVKKLVKKLVSSIHFT